MSIRLNPTKRAAGTKSNCVGSAARGIKKASAALAMLLITCRAKQRLRPGFLLLQPRPIHSRHSNAVAARRAEQSETVRPIGHYDNNITHGLRTCKMLFYMRCGWHGAPLALGVIKTRS